MRSGCQRSSRFCFQAILISHWKAISKTFFLACLKILCYQKKEYWDWPVHFVYLFIYKSQSYKLQVNWLVVRCLKKMKCKCAHSSPNQSISVLFYVCSQNTNVHTSPQSQSISVLHLDKTQMYTLLLPKAVHQCFLSIHSKVILDTPQNSPCHGS